jgi:ferredoxin
MKIVVDRDLCEANAICSRQTGEVFRVEEDDTLTILLEEVPPSLEQKVFEAERLCPRQALKVIS